VDGKASDALLKLGRFFTRWEESDDGRVAFRKGGRAGDVFYRDRWSHDKVVRSTHGVNCTVPAPGRSMSVTGSSPGKPNRPTIRR
jgi:nitrate reductase alpha subunit